MFYISHVFENKNVTCLYYCKKRIFPCMKMLFVSVVSQGVEFNELMKGVWMRSVAHVMFLLLSSVQDSPQFMTAFSSQREAFTDRKWGAQIPSPQCFSIHKCRNWGSYALWLFSKPRYCCNNCGAHEKSAGLPVLVYLQTLENCGSGVWAPHSLFVNMALRITMPDLAIP